ncbi:MAG: 2'-5' RNA ligase family protein [Limnohabitans sp.]|nr:2'-5' RNA ligase family protein [Limnohabitans sp.]
MLLLSVIIHPSDEIIEEVRLMKETLASKIGWYHSKNSLAHITINELETNESELEKIKRKLSTISRYLKTQEVIFDDFGTFPNGAFFLSPDVDSRLYLKNTMQDFHNSFDYKTTIKSSEPHISIGRKLTLEQIEIGKALFEKPNLSFTCNRIALRLFNTERRQFDIIEEYSFGNECRGGEQGVLF